MMTGKEDLLFALGEAFLMEKGTKIFYEEAAVRAEHEDARKTFRYLSEWENEHMDYVLTLYKGIIEDWSLVTYDEFKKRSEARETEAGVSLQDLEGRIETYRFTDEMGALTLAMEVEGKAYNMYRRLSQVAADNNTRVIFQELMDQEGRHVKHLKELRTKLANVCKI